MQHQLSFIAVAPDSATRVALETWLGQTTFGQSTSCPVQLLSAPKDASEVAPVICWIPRALSNLTEHIWVFLYFAAITMDLGWPATLLQSTPQLRPHQGLRFGTPIFAIKTSSKSCVAKLAMKRFEQHRHKFCLPGKCSTSCQVIGSGDQWPDCRFIAFVTTPLVWKGWLISFGKAWDEKSFVILKKRTKNPFELHAKTHFRFFEFLSLLVIVDRHNAGGEIPGSTIRSGPPSMLWADICSGAGRKKRSQGYSMGKCDLGFSYTDAARHTSASGWFTTQKPLIQGQGYYGQIHPQERRRHPEANQPK